MNRYVFCSVRWQLIYFHIETGSLSINKAEEKWKME